jgi:hypothetical protein
MVRLAVSLLFLDAVERSRDVERDPGLVGQGDH